MKVAVLGDVHLIAEGDPYKRLHDRRAFFKSSWPSFQNLLKKVNNESPDFVILLGDLVDWFSPENVAFGLDLLSGLNMPWYMTPGNHDLAAPVGGFDQEDYKTEATRDHVSYWKMQGIDLTHRTIAVDGCQIVLLDSALSDLPEGSEGMLDEIVNDDDTQLWFTHVPVDVPKTREYILSVDPRRSLIKYVISGAPDLYSKYIENRVAHIFSGHLHFAGDLSCDTTRFHLCNMGITMYDPNRKQSAVASATVIEGDGNGLAFRKITVD